VKSFCLIIGLLLLTALCFGQTPSPAIAAPAAVTMVPVTTQPAAAMPVNPSGLSFTGSSEVTAFRYSGATSVGTKITQSLDFVDWGTAKANHFSVVGYEFLAPTPGISFYGGGGRVDPDLSKLLNKTNVTSGQLGVFAEGAVGIAVTQKATGVGYMLGGGIKYQITSSLGWNSLSVNYLRLGNVNAVSMSTGLSYIFK